MKKTSWALYALVICLMAVSCKLTSRNAKPEKVGDLTNNDTATLDGHPAWIMQGNIYEVNVRQYTPEGTFKAFEKSLDRLKDMGVQTLWFMPINPISKTDRKGSLGSYYAVSNYTAINPEFGTMDDWKELVNKAHDMGFKVIIDWVPNHTGADHYWLTTHPDFYVKDSTGKPAMAADWADTRKLNYANAEFVDTMINSMKFWLTESNIDGFRCDVATGPTDKFWQKCIPQLRAMKNIFMLGEGDTASLNKDGFDATYSWSMFAMMKKVAKGERTANALDSVRLMMDSTYPANALKMTFTSDHDENSWGNADFGTMPGPINAPFAVYSFTEGKDIPLIYSGQEEPFLRAIRFFDKDTITFKNYARADFYKKLLALRKTNAALASDANFTKVSVGNDKALYAFTKEKAGKKVLVILNLSAKPQQVKITDASLLKETTNVFMGTKETLKTESWGMEPWGYAVYEY